MLHIENWLIRDSLDFQLVFLVEAKDARHAVSVV